MSTLPDTNPESNSVPDQPTAASTPAAAAPAPAGEAKPASISASASPVAAHSSVSRSGTLILGLLALVMAVMAGVAAFVLSQRLEDARQELARRNDEVVGQVTEARNTASESDALAKELQARLQVAEIKLSEVSLQRSQLEELMLSLSRSRDDNLVQDLESSIRLAQQQAQLTGSVQPLVSALQAADQRIARAAQPRLNPVQRAIVRDIDRIQVAALADIPALVTQLDDMARSVDEWPVRNEVGPLSTSKPSDIPALPVAPGVSADRLPSTESASSGDRSAEGQSSPTLPAATADAQAQTASPQSSPAAGALDLPDVPVAQGWLEQLNGLWTRLWNGMTRKGAELVRVSRLDHPESALLAPEQAFFLRENTKLRLLNARLGLLARQFDSVKADMASVQSHLDRYYDERAPAVAQAREAILKLQEEVKTSEMPRPEETLAALATAAGGR